MKYFRAFKPRYAKIYFKYVSMSFADEKNLKRHFRFNAFKPGYAKVYSKSVSMRFADEKFLKKNIYASMRLNQDMQKSDSNPFQ